MERFFGWLLIALGTGLAVVTLIVVFGEFVGLDPTTLLF